MSETQQRKRPERHSRADVLGLIVDEVDAARDTLELVSQLEHALPIRNFEELRRACGENSELRFRGTTFDVKEVETLLPYWAFPVDDIQGLVGRVAHAVRLLPADLMVDQSNPDFVSRQMRRQFFGGIPNGFPTHGNPSRRSLTTPFPVAGTPAVPGQDNGGSE